MPDVISNVQSNRVHHADAFMEDEQGTAISDEDRLMSHLNNNTLNRQTINLLSLDTLTNDPMLSASSSSLSLNHQQHSTVDMSAITTNYGLINMQQHSNCENQSVESILQSDSDSLIDDIDMMS